ncbi:hypothetical protein D3C73_873590 [compost metagenome]
MSPETGVPGFVKGIQRAVTVLQPDPESGFRLLGIVVAAIFIGNMPGHQARMVLVALSQLARKLGSEFTVDRTIRIGVVASAEFALSALHIDPGHFRVTVGHPGRMGPCACSQADIGAIVI